MWDLIHFALLDWLARNDQIDWSRAVVDSCSIRAVHGGDQTGPNPTDRAKRGSKRHLICDGRGVPLAVRLTGANRNDSQEALALVDADPLSLAPIARSPLGVVASAAALASGAGTWSRSTLRPCRGSIALAVRPSKARDGSRRKNDPFKEFEERRVLCAFASMGECPVAVGSSLRDQPAV